MLHRYSIAKESLAVSPLALARILYRGAGEDVIERKSQSAEFAGRFARLLETYTHMLEPSGFSRAVEVGYIREIFDRTLPYSSPIYMAVDQWVKGAVFVVSIGSALENSVRSLSQRGEITDALFLDALGSILVEGAANRVQDEWEKSLEEQGEKEIGTVAVRYSPGYCQWDVKAQEELFACIGGDGIPVSLTPGGMMHPRKSISGIMVMEKTDSASPYVAACRYCGKKCRYSRMTGI